MRGVARMERKQMPLRLPPWLAERAKVEADKQGVSLNAWIAAAIRAEVAYADEREREPQP